MTASKDTGEVGLEDGRFLGGREVLACAVLIALRVELPSTPHGFPASVRELSDNGVVVGFGWAGGAATTFALAFGATNRSAAVILGRSICLT